MTILLISVHDLPLLLLGPDHQDRFPGRHRKAVRHQSEAVALPTFLSGEIVTIVQYLLFFFQTKKFADIG
jgi:hypothetical protein